jgi:hypothetical protein
VTPTVAIRSPTRSDVADGWTLGQRFTRLVRVLVCVAAAAPIAAYLWVALHRIGYSYELDWMEGGSVELVGRVVAGHSLYAAPSLGFVGWTYPPLYYWIAAGVAKLTGVGFLPLRLVSLLASLVSMATLGWIVVRETGNRTAGLVAAGLFAATFRVSGAWFDTGRVDSLFLAITLLAVAWCRRARGVRGGIGVGAIVFLAFFTKQTALVALLPIVAYLVLTRRRVGVAALLTLVALMLASTAVLDGLTGGWYRYYVFSELSGQPWAHQVWVGFWADDILRRQWPLLLLLVAGEVTLARATLAGRSTARPTLRSPWPYYACAATGMIAAAWVSRLHTGGYANVLMPAFAAIAMLAGLTWGRVLKRRRRPMTLLLLLSALLLQLSLLAYPLGAQIPTAADRAAGTRLIARLRTLPGPVVVIRHPWYSTQAGKGVFAQEEAIGDVLRSGASRGARAMRASLHDALNTYHVQAVVLDGPWDAQLFGPELTRDFRLRPGPITPSPLYPLTDVRTAPTQVYVRIHPPPAKRAARHESGLTSGLGGSSRLGDAPRRPRFDDLAGGGRGKLAPSAGDATVRRPTRRERSTRVPEGLSAAEVGKEIAEHHEHPIKRGEIHLLWEAASRPKITTGITHQTAAPVAALTALTPIAAATPRR